MKALWLLCAAALVAGNQEPAANVNSRYTVESVEIRPPDKFKVSDTLAGEMRKLIGVKFDHEVLERLGRRIRRELKMRVVSMKVTKGTQPDHVKVFYEPSERGQNTDVVQPRFIYHAKQNFTFGADATWRHSGHNFSGGILTDNDELIERYSGVRGGYERSGLAANHLAIKFDLETWRAQWSGATRAALDTSPEVPGIYRTRFHFRPAATVTIVKPLTVTAGISFQSFETQFPAARTENSTAAFGTLRFRGEWEPSPVHHHKLDAGYNLRAATRTLDSDFVYTRHFWDIQYTYKGAHDTLIAAGMAGSIYGRAPLFERFVLGNSRTLRGWNKYDLDPLGGDRMGHGSLDYRYRWFRAVYDVGSTWRRGQQAQVRQSIAAGLGEDSFWALVAFPIREGRADPIFMIGLNF